MSEETKTKLSGVTRDEIIHWGGVSTFNQALPIVQTGSVTEVAYNPNTGEIKGKILQYSGNPKEKPWQMPVSFFRYSPGVIKSNCTCRTNINYGQICPHVVALGLTLLIQEMEIAAKEAKGDSSGLMHKRKDVDPDEDKYIPIPSKPKISAYVSGSRASLSVEIDAHYGNVEFPAASAQPPKTVWLEDAEDSLVRRTRSIDAERSALEYIKTWGFKPGYGQGDVKFYMTDQRTVLNFLGKGLPALRRLGWRVDLSDRLMKVADAMQYVVPVVKIKDAGGGDFLVRYDFEAGGKLVSPIEIQAALNRGDAFIQKGDETILVDIDAIGEMHKVLTDCVEIQEDKNDSGWLLVNRVHAPFVKSSLERIDAEVDFDEAQEWLHTAKNFGKEDGDDKAKFEPVELGNFEKILRPYQKQGVYWMRFLENAGYNGLLADEMGLGKTVQTLAWLSLRAASSKAANSADGFAEILKNSERKANSKNADTSLKSISTSLIVCPTSLLWNWAAEIDKFIPETKVLVVDEAPESPELAQVLEYYDLVITSYPRLHRDFEDLYRDVEFDAIVLDEAQRIKNHRTKTSQATKRLRSKRRLVLTGTPVENTVIDVWSIFDFLMPGYLGDYESFKHEYANPAAEGGPLGDQALAKLERKLRPFILRRLKKMVAKDLPDKITKIFYSPLDDKAMAEYHALLRKTRHEVGNIVRQRGFKQSRLEILARLTKLRMTSSRGKMNVFLEQLDEAISGGHRILVFSQFVSTLKLIAKELDKENIQYCYLDGETKERLEVCNKFNHDRRIPVFLISLMAGGTGLNLTGADMVFHYDPWWNPAIEEQATDRTHRIGQKKNVYVIKMIAPDTIEEKVLELQRRKKAVIAATVSATDAAIMSKLTAEDIGQLLEDDE